MYYESNDNQWENGKWKMQLLKTVKTVEEEQAEHYELPEFVYDPLFGKAHFNEPGFQ